MSFKDWKVAEGSRLYQSGAPALSVSELLAHVLRDVDAARALLDTFNGIRELGRAAYDELVKVHGISGARAEQILAAVELGKRFLAAPEAERRTVTCPDDAFEILGPEIGARPQEVFVAVLLNSKNQVLKTETVSVGTVNASIVHPREVFKPAINASATAVILAHNHPTGNPEPSREDILITERMVKTGRVLGIDVVDHIIVAADRYVSMKERGNI
jgi:DNA repair protein RadC